MKKLIRLGLIFFWVFYGLPFPDSVSGQTVEQVYREPLTDVLKEIENRFQVKLVYDEKDVKDKTVSYARWRFKTDLEPTLYSVLGPFDMVFSKNAAGAYEISVFQYHKRSVDEGKKHLEKLLSLCPALTDWEKRKSELRKCITEQLGLSSFPAKNPLNPIYTPMRKYDGYTAENVAIETLPGVYLSGTLYHPLRKRGPFPAVLLAQGHGEIQHYGESSQILAATLARMGAVVFSYDMFAKGESGLQFAFEDHRTGLAQTMQTWNSGRVVDFLTSLSEVDKTRIAMTGASGGGTQTILATALDSRISVSIPVVMVSSWFFGGCPCESGMPVHSCGAWGTNNAEIAAMAAPRAMLLVSDGKDWTSATPEIEFPYMKRMYSLCGSPEKVENVHLPAEGHDYGPSKRNAAVRFLAEQFKLPIETVPDKSGKIDESKCTVEKKEAMLVFGEKGENLPANAIHGITDLKKIINRTE